MDLSQLAVAHEAGAKHHICLKMHKLQPQLYIIVGASLANVVGCQLRWPQSSPTASVNAFLGLIKSSSCLKINYYFHHRHYQYVQPFGPRCMTMAVEGILPSNAESSLNFVTESLPVRATARR
jgi:hypothetical protein